MYNKNNKIKGVATLTRKKLVLEDALSLLLSAANPLMRQEEIALVAAEDRVLAANLYAKIDQPPFDRSALDGYALQQEDVVKASLQNPICLKVTQKIFAGDFSDLPLQKGEAARIMTGAPIPPGANCVIAKEETNNGEEQVVFFAGLGNKSNICQKGEDVLKDTLLLAAGESLNYVQLGLLAGQGYTHLPVFAKPRVGLMATGDELLPAGTPLRPGKIYDSNSTMLGSRLATLGCEPVFAPHYADDPQGLALTIKELAKECDAIITCGGVSVGDRDFLPLIAGMLGGKNLFLGLALKPGTPTLAFFYQGLPVLCLSGNPFAAATSFELLGRPLLEKLAGQKIPKNRRLQAVVKGSFNKHSHFRRFVRGYYWAGEVSIPDSGHSSGILSSFAGCNCLVDIEAGSGTVKKGDLVEIVLI